MSNDFVVAQARILSAPVDEPIQPRTKMENLVKTMYEAATNPEDGQRHHAWKILMDRLVPERKQVEHFGHLENQGQKTEFHVHLESDNAAEETKHDRLAASGRELGGPDGSVERAGSTHSLERQPDGSFE